MITSEANRKVKYVQRLQKDRRHRLAERVFVSEGTRWAAELINQQHVPNLIFYTLDWQQSANHAQILQQLELFTQRPALMVSNAVMKAMADTETPPGILTVSPAPELPLPHDPSWLLVLDSIRTPGNLGTLLRTAAAAGVEGVLLAPGTVDATNPKVVRGSMGALLRLPIRRLDWAEFVELVKGMQVWLAAADGDVAYTAVDWRQSSVLIIGGEAGGASAEARRFASGAVTIPMHGGTESLNAAIAGAVILFEAKRQRDKNRHL